NDAHAAARSGAAARDASRRAGDEGADAAIVLVLERRSDAEARGHTIYATIDGDLEQGVFAPSTALAQRGDAHAASGMVSIAAGALALYHRITPFAGPWISSAPRSFTAPVRPMAGLGAQVVLSGASSALPRFQRVPRLSVFAGDDVADVAARLASGEPGGAGPARCVIVARDADELRVRASRAVELVRRGQTSGAGVRFAARPAGGELAFVFSAAGASYAGMGRALLTHLPELGDRLAARDAGAADAIAWAFAEGRSPSPLERLWGASALCQLHAELSLELLGLRPHAAIGYSSGESNSLFAFGVWRDVDGMRAESARSGLFSAVPGWEMWSVRAPLASVEALVAATPGAHVAIVHSDADVVVSGDAAACARVVGRVGVERCRRIDYALRVHTEGALSDRTGWLALHDRPVFPPRDGVRIYSNAIHGAYTPTREACRDLVTRQTTERLDLRPTIERAYADGVRVFVEHGPRAACSGWIREILAGRDATIVALDDEGHGLPRLYDALATLVAAGVDVAHEHLTDRLSSSTKPRSPKTVSFPAHPPAITLPPPATLDVEPTQPFQPTPGVIEPLPEAPELAPVLGLEPHATTAHVDAPRAATGHAMEPRAATAHAHEPRGATAHAPHA
ncbi:beta-ketoacyl synthase, partial [Myxococcota bacterium]|nr:beta-ketoacyl synthase [Myxococcota bacterium]